MQPTAPSFLLIDYLPLVREIREQIDDVRGMTGPRILSRIDAFVEASQSEGLRGDGVLARLYASLDSCGLERTSTQRFFHKKIRRKYTSMDIWEK